MSNFVEMINVEQLAGKLGVSRSTIFSWIKSGVLKPGTHYMQVNRTIRFQWGPEFIEQLRAISAQKSVEYKRPPIKNASPMTKRHNYRGNGSANLDY